jgi:hypothetical protein
MSRARFPWASGGSARVASFGAAGLRGWESLVGLQGVYQLEALQEAFEVEIYKFADKAPALDLFGGQFLLPIMEKEHQPFLCTFRHIRDPEGLQILVLSGGQFLAMFPLRVLPQILRGRKDPPIQTENAGESLGRFRVLSELLNPSIRKIRLRRLHPPALVSTFVRKRLEKDSKKSSKMRLITHASHTSAR